jgi:hypothetical protein
MGIVTRFCDWVMGRDKEWLAGTRFQPCSDPDDISKWAVSVEFYAPKAKNIRTYTAVRKDRGKLYVDTVLCDMKDLSGVDGVKVETRSGFGGVPAAVKYLVDFEQKMKKDGWFPIESSRATYRAFANHYGYHIDAQGGVFKMSDGDAATRDMILTKKGLDAVFRAAAGDEVRPIDDWAGLHARLVVEKLVLGREVESFFDLMDMDILEQAVEQWPATNTLDALPVLLRDEFCDRNLIWRPDEITSVVEKRLCAANGMPEALEDTHKKRMELNPDFWRIRSASTLICALREGQKFYEETLADGTLFAPEKMSVLKAFGDACVSFAFENVGLSEKEAKKLPSLMMRGPDETGAPLPVHALLQAAKEYQARPKPVAEVRPSAPRRGYGITLEIM